MFSNACKYGIRAITYVASQSIDGNRVNISEISENADCPEAFISKILSSLKRKGLIESYKGVQGGYEISKELMHTIKVSDIVDAIDGDTVYNGCALGLHKCDPKNPCPLHFKFVRIRENLKLMLESTSIYDLAIELKTGKSTLINTSFSDN